MAYAEDLKSSGAKAPCGFDPRPRHKVLSTFGASSRRRFSPFFTHSGFSIVLHALSEWEPPWTEPARRLFRPVGPRAWPRPRPATWNPRSHSDRTSMGAPAPSGSSRRFLEHPPHPIAPGLSPPRLGHAILPHPPPP